jgi:hypothetical protein
VKETLIRIVAGLAVLYAAYAGWIYYLMCQPPMRFAAVMAKLPPVAMMSFPFQTMWSRARAGVLQVGAEAPDFNLQTVGKAASVRLSSFRGDQPVVLVFGSYT